MVLFVCELLSFALVFKVFCSETHDEKNAEMLTVGQVVVEKTLATMRSRTRDALQELGRVGGDVADDLIREAATTEPLLSLSRLNMSCAGVWDSVPRATAHKFMQEVVKKHKFKKAVDAVRAHARCAMPEEDLSIVARVQAYDDLFREVDRLYKRRVERREAVMVLTNMLQEALNGVLEGVKHYVGFEGVLRILNGELSLRVFMDEAMLRKKAQERRAYDHDTSRSSFVWQDEQRFLLLKLVNAGLNPLHPRNEAQALDVQRRAADLRGKAYQVAAETLTKTQVRVQRVLVEFDRCDGIVAEDFDQALSLREGSELSPEVASAVRDLSGEFVNAIAGVYDVHDAIGRLLQCTDKYYAFENKGILRDLEDPRSLIMGVLKLENRRYARTMAVEALVHRVMHALYWSGRIPSVANKVFRLMCSKASIRIGMQTMARAMEKEYRSVVGGLLREGASSFASALRRK